MRVKTEFISLSCSTEKRYLRSQISLRIGTPLRCLAVVFLFIPLRTRTSPRFKEYELLSSFFETMGVKDELLEFTPLEFETRN